MPTPYCLHAREKQHGQAGKPGGVATAHQEGRGAFAGLFHPHGGKTGGVGDIDGGYHPGRGAVPEKN